MFFLFSDWQIHSHVVNFLKIYIPNIHDKGIKIFANKVNRALSILGPTFHIKTDVKIQWYFLWPKGSTMILPLTSCCWPHMWEGLVWTWQAPTLLFLWNMTGIPWRIYRYLHFPQVISLWCRVESLVCNYHSWTAQDKCSLRETFLFLFITNLATQFSFSKLWIGSKYLWISVFFPTLINMYCMCM